MMTTSAADNTYDEANATQRAEYGSESLAVLEGLAPTRPRSDYYLIGDFDHVDPVSDHGILWAWSQYFLTTAAATLMLELVEGDTLGEIALQLDIPLPTESAISPEEAAAILGDEPVGVPCAEAYSRWTFGIL
jgi:hypothetical protein